MAGLLTDQVAVVTGGASGIGREIALTFADHGAAVVVADVRETPREGGTTTHERIRDETDADAAFVECDVSNRDDWRDVVEAAAKLGGVNVLVNNAGIFRMADFFDVTPEEYDQLMDINVKGAFFGSKIAGDRMVESGEGSIINVSSIAGLVGNGNYVTYCMSKGALRLMTYALAHALGPHGIRVNAIHPGAIETAMMQDADMSDEVLDQFVQQVPSRRIGEPDDIAGAAV